MGCRNHLLLLLPAERFVGRGTPALAEDRRFPSIGVALRHNRMAILDQEGRVLPESARGEICIRGGTVCAGYFKREDANQAAFQWGWFRSGDEGFYQQDGKGRPFFFVSGRLRLVIRGGVNISPWRSTTP
ncbi:MAG: AMP-binding protein [Nitrospiraceae bacterium]